MTDERQKGTLTAIDTTTGAEIVFLDRVHDGGIVHVYRSVDHAQGERGFLRRMRVVWTPDEWKLRPE